MSDADHIRPPSRRLTVLMTEGSSISARQILYELGPRHTIDVLDPSPACQCRFSRFVRRWYQCPSFAADPCGFLSFLSDRLHEGRYDVLLPPHDEVFLLSRVREALGRRVAVALPEFEALERLQSKLQFLKLLRELDLPHPETDVLDSAREIDRWSDFPRYAKLDYGTAGQTVRLVHDRRELQAALEAFKQRGWSNGDSPVLMQRPAMGQQASVRGVFRRGRLVASHTGILRMRGVGGAAIAHESIDHPIAVEHLRRMGEQLGWHGWMFADYFFDPATGDPQYVEADPRVGEAACASLSGVNFSQHWIDVALDREVAQPTTSTPGTRSHAAILILMSKALDGANRRELCRELCNQWYGVGIYEGSKDEMTRPRDDWMSVLPLLYVAGRLSVRPAAAHQLVHDTVGNYALTAEAAARIRNTPLERFAVCLGDRQVGSPAEEPVREKLCA